MTFGLKARICETVTPIKPSSMGIKNKFCKAYTTPIMSTMAIKVDAIFKTLLKSITSPYCFFLKERNAKNIASALLPLCTKCALS